MITTQNRSLQELKNSDWYAGVEFYLSQQVSDWDLSIDFQIGQINMAGALDGFRGNQIKQSSDLYLKNYAIAEILRQDVKVHCCCCPCRASLATRFANHPKSSTCSLFDRESITS